MAWVELIGATFLAALILLSLRVFAGRTTSLIEILSEGFLRWLQIYLLLFGAAFCMIPAYMFSGFVLVGASVFSDVPTREFMRNNFNIVFVPSYLIVVGLFAYWLARDSEDRDSDGLTASVGLVLCAGILLAIWMGWF